MQKIKIWKRSHGSPVAKIAGRHKNSVHKYGRMCFQAVISSRIMEGNLFPRVEMPWRSPCLAVKRLDRLYRCHTALLKVYHHGLALLPYKWCPGTGFSLSHSLWISVHVFVHVCVQAENSDGTTVGPFSKFLSFAWSLHAPSLSFLSYAIMRSHS